MPAKLIEQARRFSASAHGAALGGGLSALVSGLVTRHTGSGNLVVPARRRPRPARSFSSVKSGDWTDPATWGDVDYPRVSGDTVTINAHTVTIPTGATGICGPITLGSNATFTLSGTFDMRGDMTIAGDNCTLNGPGGGLWWHNGHTVQNNGSGTTYNLGGTSRDSMFVVFGGGSQFAHIGGKLLISNVNYAKFVGVKDSTFGNSQVTALVQKFCNSDWIACGGLILEATVGGGITDAGFQFNGNNVRDCRSDMVQLGIPYCIYGNQALGVNPREIKNNCYDTGYGPGQPPQILLQNVKCGASGWFDGNILGHVAMAQSNNANEGFVANNNFWFIRYRDNYDAGGNPAQADALMLVGGTCLKSFTNSYVYVENQEHFFSGNQNGSAWTFNNFVFENAFKTASGISGPGANWFINPGDNGTIYNGICLGVDYGNLAVVTKACAYPTGLIGYGITFYTDNENLGSSNDRFPMAWSMEQIGSFTGTVKFYNCIHYDIDLNVTPQDFIVANETGVAATIDRVSNWCGWPLAPQIQALNLTITNGGGHLNVDPQFADKTRNLAKWDASLGGPGTAEHAINELLKMNGYGGTYNSAYNTAAAIAYVFAGFQPTGSGATALNGTGYLGGNIGAR